MEEQIETTCFIDNTPQILSIWQTELILKAILLVIKKEMQEKRIQLDSSRSRGTYVKNSNPVKLPAQEWAHPVGVLELLDVPTVQE